MKYDRIDVNLLDKEGNEFRGQVYKMHQSDVFSYPSTDYLRACAFTSMAYHYLNPWTKDYNLGFKNIYHIIIIKWRYRVK